MAEQRTAQANMDMLLKEKVQYLNTKIKENNQRHEVELVRSLEEKEVPTNINANYSYLVQFISSYSKNSYSNT